MVKRSEIYEPEYDNQEINYSQSPSFSNDYQPTEVIVEEDIIETPNKKSSVENVFEVKQEDAKDYSQSPNNINENIVKPTASTNNDIATDNFSLEAEKVEGAPYRTDGKPQIPNISPADKAILSAQTGYKNMLASSEPTKEERAATEKARNEAIDWITKGTNTQNGIGISNEEKAKANKTIQDWNNRKTYDPTNKPAQTEEEIIAEIESENPVEETIGDRLRASYGNDVNVQLGSDGKYYTGEGKNPIQISAGSINTTYKDVNGVEKQTKSDVYRLADGTYVYEDGNGTIQTLTEAQYKQAKQPTNDANRKAQTFRDEAFRQLRDNPNLTDEELWVYLADKVGKNAYAKDRGLKFGNFFNWKNVVKELRADFKEEQQRKLQQEQTISNELWNRDARGNLIEGGIVSIVGGKPKTIGDVNSLRRDLISFNEDATPEEKAALLNKHLPADKQITAEEANTITDLNSAYNLLKTKGGDEFEEYMELGGVELDADGNVKVQKPIDNLEEYLSEFNTKEKEKLELDRAKAKRNLELRMEAFRDIAKNIGNTISVSMGANSLGTDNDNIYKNIEDKYRQKVLAYEAKMEQMRQEKMAEKQRKEAMALQEAQMRAAAQKAAADRELEMWKTMAGFQNKKDLQDQKLKAEAEQKALDRALKNKELKFEQDKNSFYYDNDGYRFTIPKSHTDNMKSEFNKILRKYLPATKFNLSIYEDNLKQSSNPIHEIKGLLIDALGGNLSSTEQDDKGNYILAEPISQEDYDKAITEISNYLSSISKGEEIKVSEFLTEF